MLNKIDLIFKSLLSINNSKFLIVFLLIVTFLFALSLFKHISYPLLWNDEAECVMHGRRVLEFGYPKVHDGKNVVYPMRHSIKNFAIDEQTDAYIGIGWSMFYYSTIGILIAKTADDLYKKSALLRLPFAILGLIGMGILALSFLPFFGETKQKLLFLIFFVLFSLLSVSLVLHLREVRYYSLVIFLGACIFNQYVNYTFKAKPLNIGSPTGSGTPTTGGIGFYQYLILMTIFLWLLFNTLVPVFFIFLAFIGLYETFQFFFHLSKKYLDEKGIDHLPAGEDIYTRLQANDHSNPSVILKKELKRYLRAISPLIVAFVLIIPLLIYFKTFYVSGETNKFYNYSSQVYFEHIFSVFEYFGKYEFIYLAVFLKIVFLILYYRVRNINQNSEFRVKNSSLMQKLQVSNFMACFFIFYIVLIALFPSYIFTRYIILLLPILSVIICFDILIVFELIKLFKLQAHAEAKRVIMVLLCTVFLFNGANNIPEITGHIYEMFHRYKGPLDHLIPFIKERYNNTENLVIAANYEECAYMYYLDSKVTMGFVLNNLESDLKTQPDIIIFRKAWNWVYPRSVFDNFFKTAEYKRIFLPVYDYPTNNIPELNMENRHLFRTRYAKNENEEVEMYVMAIDNRQ